MSTLMIELPDSLKESIEELAAKEGYPIVTTAKLKHRFQGFSNLP